jgi:nucleoid-associated protein YgaU
MFTGMKIWTTVCLGLVLAVSGCQTTGGDYRDTEAHRDTRYNNLQRDVESLKTQANESDDARQMQMREMDRMRAEYRDAQAALEKEIAALKAALEALDAKRAQDRKEIIDVLTGKMLEIMKAQAPTGGGGVLGREHVVQSGETLSAIAAAYGSTVNAIVKANKLQNAHAIRVGQKLFIPE